MVGKLGPEALAAIFEQTGATDPDVQLGPAYGEDAAIIHEQPGDIIVSTDPISFAADRVGTLGVHVACNDVAVSGADPRWLTCVIMVPDESVVAEITEQLDSAARTTDVAIIGGHTEVLVSLDRPLLSLTAIGTTATPIETGGGNAGDRIVLTGGAGIEATAILASDFGEDLPVPVSVIESGLEYYEDISVISPARILREYASGMHDPTEGGVLAGLYELGSATELTAEVSREAIPIREPTERLCGAAGVDPLCVFGSGSVLGTVPPDAIDAAMADLESAGIAAATIGELTADGTVPVKLDDEAITEPVRDEMYDLWA